MRADTDFKGCPTPAATFRQRDRRGYRSINYGNCVRKNYLFIAGEYLVKTRQSDSRPKVGGQVGLGVFQIKLFSNIFPMEIDGAGTFAEQGGNLLGGFPLGDEL